MNTVLRSAPPKASMVGYLTGMGMRRSIWPSGSKRSTSPLAKMQAQENPSESTEAPSGPPWLSSTATVANTRLFDGVPVSRS